MVVNSHQMLMWLSFCSCPLFIHTRPITFYWLEAVSDNKCWLSWQSKNPITSPVLAISWLVPMDLLMPHFFHLTGSKNRVMVLNSHQMSMRLSLWCSCPLFIHTRPITFYWLEAVSDNKCWLSWQSTNPITSPVLAISWLSSLWRECVARSSLCRKSWTNHASTDWW